MKKKKDNSREKVLNTNLGKDTYKKLTISTIILIIGLFGLAIIMTTFCKCCIEGFDWNKIKLSFNLFPIFLLISLVAGSTTSYYFGGFNTLLKINKK